MTTARTQYFYSFSNFISRNVAFLVGGSKNADCTHYVETDCFGDMPCPDFIDKKQIGIQTICQNECLTFTKIKPCSSSKQGYFLRVDILYFNEFAFPDFFRFFKKVRICS